MMSLTSDEWAILIIGVVLLLGFLHYRSTKKQKSGKLRHEIARKVYKTALIAQSNAITGVSQSKMNGSGINDLRMPLDLQDPTRMYTRDIMMNSKHRDFLMENEYLQIGIDD